MVLHPFRSRLLLGLSFGAFVLGSLSATRAQTLNDGAKALESKHGSYRSLLRALFKGDARADANDMRHVEAIDTHAKYITYDVVLNHLEDSPGKINNAFQEFEGDVKDILKARDREVIQPLAELYRDKVRIHALEVIQFDKAKPVHRIHAARILAKAAELGQGKLSETLLSLLQDDKQNGGVHYYALRGLRTLLSMAQAQAQTQAQQAPPVLSKDEEAKCAEGIIAFLNRKPALTAGATPQEVDGFRLLRREGVRALAQIRTPEFSDKVRPAFVLARFTGGDEGIQPPPRIDERLEAAIGLARMQPGKKDTRYQPDYAAAMIAKFVGTFTTEANNNFEAKERRRPWKIDAARLSAALQAFKAESGKNPFVARVVDNALPVLQVITTGREKVNADRFTWFTTSQSDPPSSSPELFKGSPDTAVKWSKQGEATEK